ncbi:hypothetical protein GDO81_022007 [Engystomops pustulosus]|uniref:Uncharacterized protein n=1 Tax=Engystomops pustulosus TaxID=76066 RepID=A0AAV6Z6E0_ENGPU|nr:hypothetical protein GDO81_022007 [Engystomops pustulosus]
MGAPCTPSHPQPSGCGKSLQDPMDIETMSSVSAGAPPTSAAISPDYKLSEHQIDLEIRSVTSGVFGSVDDFSGLVSTDVVRETTATNSLPRAAASCHFPPSSWTISVFGSRGPGWGHTCGHSAACNIIRSTSAAAGDRA